MEKFAVISGCAILGVGIFIAFWAGYNPGGRIGLPDANNSRVPLENTANIWGAIPAKSLSEKEEASRDISCEEMDKKYHNLDLMKCRNYLWK